MEPRTPPPASPVPSTGPAQRARDSDREAAAQALRDAGADGRLDVSEMEERLAQLFAAKTHPEIDRLLADLKGREALTPRPGGDIAAGDSDGTRPRDRMVTIMSENTRRGFWRPAARTRVVTVMGDALIDLSEAQLTAPVTEIRVFTLMGSTKLDVPDNVHVEVTKLTIMSNHEVLTAEGPPPSDAPRLRIHLVSIMGEAKVRWARRRTPAGSDLYA